MLYGIKIVGALFIFIVGRWVVRRICNATTKLMTLRKLDEALVKFSSNLAYLGLLVFVVIATIAGALAKWIIPGEDPGGVWVTILIGIVGAFLGGFVGSLVGIGTTGGLSIGSILTAVGGALLLLLVYPK